MQAAAPVAVQRCVGRILSFEIVYMLRGFVVYGFLDNLNPYDKVGVWIEIVGYILFWWPLQNMTYAEKTAWEKSSLEWELEVERKKVQQLEEDAASLRTRLRESQSERARLKDLASGYRVERTEAHSATAHLALDVHKALELLTTAASAIPSAARAHVDAISTMDQRMHDSMGENIWRASEDHGFTYQCLPYHL